MGGNINTGMLDLPHLWQLSIQSGKGNAYPAGHDQIYDLIQLTRAIDRAI